MTTSKIGILINKFFCFSVTKYIRVGVDDKNETSFDHFDQEFSGMGSGTMGIKFNSNSSGINGNDEDDLIRNPLSSTLSSAIQHSNECKSFNIRFSLFPLLL